MTEPRYHINLFWSDEDACWIAEVPDLKPCSAHGATSSEAFVNVCHAIDGWLATATERGMPIPEPRYVPGSYGVASWRSKLDPFLRLEMLLASERRKGRVFVFKDR